MVSINFEQDHFIYKSILIYHLEKYEDVKDICVLERGSYYSGRRPMLKILRIKVTSKKIIYISPDALSNKEQILLKKNLSHKCSQRIKEINSF